MRMFFYNANYQGLTKSKRQEQIQPLNIIIILKDSNYMYKTEVFKAFYVAQINRETVPTKMPELKTDPESQP
jgi:hypothetical protein